MNNRLRVNPYNITRGQNSNISFYITLKETLKYNKFELIIHKRYYSNLFCKLKLT